MPMHAKVTGNLLEIQNQSPLTQGTVGQTLSAAFSADWVGLSVTAIFSAGALTRDVLGSDGFFTIPWELLAEAQHELTLNFHGTNAAGSLILCTNIASLGKILPSRAPSGDPPDAPSPARADQIQLLAEQALALAQEVHDELEESGGPSVEPYTSAPAALGTASPGSSSNYARGDHVHPKPSASDLGAVAADQGAGNAGKWLKVDTDGSVITADLPVYSGGVS